MSITPDRIVDLQPDLSPLQIEAQINPEIIPPIVNVHEIIPPIGNISPLEESSLSDLENIKANDEWNTGVLLAARLPDVSEVSSDDLKLIDKDSISRYLYEISRTPLLKPSEEIQLALSVEEGKQARIKLTENLSSPLENKELQGKIKAGEEAKKSLTEANLRLVVSIAKKYLGRDMAFLDLIQEGNLGLMIAVDKFDLRMGCKLATYATWWIRQSINRAIAYKARTIRLPEYVVDLIGQVKRTERILQQETGLEPTTAEVADRMQISQDKIMDIKKAAMYPVSIDEPMGEDGEYTLGDIISDPDRDPLEKVTRMLVSEELADVLRELPVRERKLLELRFGLRDGKERTLAQVGKEMGVTSERIRQIELRALGRLSHPSKRIRLLNITRD